MTLRRTEPGDAVTVLHRWAGGLSWVAHPDEEMHRTSHALLGDGGGIWLVDPVDATDLDDALADLGEVVGVVVLTNSHGRHAGRIADRHDVPVHVPACFADDWRASWPIDRFDGPLGDSGYELVWETAGGGWQEGALYHPEHRTLVVADVLGTTLFSGRTGGVELFPLFKWSPPREAFGELAVDRLLVGHGPPVLDRPEAELQRALGVSKPAAIADIVRNVPTFLRIAVHQVRT